MNIKSPKKKKDSTFNTGTPQPTKHSEQVMTPEKKNLRLSIILVVSITGLMLMRAINTLLPLSDNISSWVFSFMVQVIFMGAIPLIMYRMLISKHMLDLVVDFRINTKIPVQSYLMAIVIGVIVGILNTGVSATWAAILRSLGYHYPNSVGTLYRTPEILIMEIITTCIFPAVFEEFTDRGLFLAIFNRESDKFKILFVGISFGILHQNVPQLIPAAIGGIIITYMAVKSGSILPGMIVHFVVNFLVTMRSYLSQTGGVLSDYSSTLINLMFQDFTTLLIFIVGAIIMLRYLLRQFTAINLKTRELVDGPSPGGRTMIIQGMKESLERNIFEIYGPSAVSEEDKITLTKEIVEAIKVVNMNLNSKGARNKGTLAQYLLYEYIPAYIGIFSALIFTILTFIFRFKP